MAGTDSSQDPGRREARGAGAGTLEAPTQRMEPVPDDAAGLLDEASAPTGPDELNDETVRVQVVRDEADGDEEDPAAGEGDRAGAEPGALRPRRLPRGVSWAGVPVPASSPAVASPAIASPAADAGSAEPVATSSRLDRTHQRRAAAALERKRRGLGYAAASVAGELMITLGVFLGLFVAWQLYWTDFQAERAQLIAAAPLEAKAGWQQAKGTVETIRHTGPPPVEEPPAKGEMIGRLHVPRFSMTYNRLISQGVDRATILDRLGIGHYPSTQMPGDLGNFAMAAHRVTYSKPFNQIATLRPGDAIIVETPTVWYVYKMTSNQIVKPSQGEVIYPNPGGQPGEAGKRRLLTMTACHPEFSAAERFVVHAELDYWMYKSEGTPPEVVTKPAR